MLDITIGAKTWTSETLAVSASAKKSLYFDSKFELAAGATYALSKDFMISAATTLDALNKPSPTYKDFGLTAGFTLAI